MNATSYAAIMKRRQIFMLLVFFSVLDYWRVPSTIGVTHDDTNVKCLKLRSVC